MGDLNQRSAAGVDSDIVVKSIDADSVSSDDGTFNDTITDPKGNTVTSLSDPVRVTEEASTFAESEITLTTNKATVSSGSIELGNAPETVDDFEDGDITTKSSNWDGWNGDTGTLSAQTSTVLSGSYTGEFYEQGSSNSSESREISTSVTNPAKPTEVSLSIQATQSGDGNDKYIFFISKGGRLNEQLARFSLFGDGTTNATGGSSVSWSGGTTYEIKFTNIDYDAQTLDIIFDGTTISSGVSFTDSPDSIDTLQFRITNWYDVDQTIYLYFDDLIAYTGDAKSGDALIEWDSGSPSDIDSWDLATFQRTLSSETVTVDVEDSNGTVLKSDISKDTDISDIATSTDVRLRANLSRTDTANNPAVDYLARRFTR
jgi:hypothetical protein